MSAGESSPSYVLTEDALLLVFNQLDAVDLRNCETVCREWQRVILSGTPWKKFFQRQVKCNRLCSQIWKGMKLDEKKLRAEHYRNICRAMFQCLQEIHKNWLEGNYVKKILRLGDTEFDPDRIRETFAVVKKKSTGEVIGVFDKGSSAFIENVRLPNSEHILSVRKDGVITWKAGEVEIFDLQTGRMKSRLSRPEALDVKCVELHEDHLAAVMVESNDKFRLVVWRIENGSEFKLLKRCTFEETFCKLISDYRYFIAYTESRANHRATTETIHLISRKTMQIERSLSIRGKSLHYRNGILIFSGPPGHVRLLDTVHGLFQSIVDISALKNLQLFECSPNFLAILDGSRKVYVYDLQAIKYPEVNSHHFLHINVDVAIYGIYMYKIDSMRISNTTLAFALSCVSGHEMRVLVYDFGVYDNFQSLSPENLQITY